MNNLTPLCYGIGIAPWMWVLMGLGALTVLLALTFAYQFAFERLEFARKTRKGL